MRPIWAEAVENEEDILDPTFDEDFVLDDKAEHLTETLLPPTVRVALRRAFTPRGMVFFDFYPRFKKMELGEPVPDDLRMQYQKATNWLIQVRSPVDQRELSPIVVNQIAEAKPKMLMLLGRLVQGRNDALTWRQINQIFVPLILNIARDKEVYLSARPMGARQWALIRKMSDHKVRVEKLKDSDPESYSLMVKYHKTLEDIDASIRTTITEAGLEVQEKFVMGRPVLYGVDSKTGEERVYDLDGEVLSHEEYVEKRKATELANEALAKIPHRTDVPVSDLRTLVDEDVDAIDGDIEMCALTDDRAKQGRLTRIFPTKKKAVYVSSEEGVRIEYQKVIVSGRYKGVFLDDMVNGVGRLIEGTAYTYSPISGREEKVPRRIDPATREPYVTVADVVTVSKSKGKTVKTRTPKLFLQIPGTKKYTGLRLAIKDMSCNTGTLRGCIPSVSYHQTPGTRVASFYFEPKDFGVIMGTLQGLSLSKSALDLVKNYYLDLSRADQASQRENVAPYSMNNIGGFKTTRKNPKTGEIKSIDLLMKQKQSLAWLDGNGGHGVCALDTGIGKCVRGDTLISTTQGLVPIREIVPVGLAPDTFVPTKDWKVQVNGKSLPVKNLYYGGYKPTLCIRTRNGFGIEGSQVHPLMTRGEAGDTFKKLPDLVVGDFLCIAREGHTFPCNEPEIQVPVRSDFNKHATSLVSYPVPNRMNPELARLLGYIVAEGWVNNPNSFTISQCPTTNQETRRDIDDLLKEQFGWSSDAVEKESWVYSRFLQLYLEWLGVDYTLSADKMIPPIILRSTRESAIQFVKSFIDAEGSVNTNCIEVTSASERLLRELQILLLHLGVVSVRTPKKVKGYRHTCWRLTIQGDNAKRYAQTVGMVSTRKKTALEALIAHPNNPNHDVVPHSKPLVEALRAEIQIRAGGQNSNGSVYKQFGAAFSHTLTHIRKDRRNPTYQFLSKMLDIARKVGAADTTAYSDLEALCHRHYFYDPIKSIESGFCEVFDVEVDSPTHSFIGNGLVNHNTLVAIAMCQKLIRDGQADDDATYTTPTGNTVKTNGRFLYVCPGPLRGNVGKEIRSFISDPKVLLDRLDVISYPQFSGSSRSRKVPVSLRGVEFWKGRRWDPALYVAIYFDEAQALKKFTTGASEAALKLWHPRKVCMTASPMERNPMEAYVLGAVSNNTLLFGNTPEAKQNRVEMRRFKERFCEIIGGRIVGVKQDPLVKHDLDTWVKRNLYYADKQDVEEFTLPNLKISTEAIQMEPTVELTYRAVTGQVPRIMRGLVGKFRDRGKGEAGTEARSPDIEKIFSNAWKPIIRLLSELSNYPETALLDVAFMIETGTLPYQDRAGRNPALPKLLQWATHELATRVSPEKLRETAAGLQNPKLTRAEDIIKQKLEKTDGRTRTLLFSDDKRLLMMAARQFSQKIVGKHAVALNDAILLFDGTGPLTEISFEIDPDLLAKLVKDPEERDRILQETGGVSRHAAPFRKLSYKKYPELPAGPGNNRYRADQWQQFVMKEVLQPDRTIKTLSLYGPIYQYGFNLQAFDTVIQLDRDRWNSESMKQRTARAWRQGQGQPVDEYTLDTTYADSLDGTPRNDFDKTLDEIRHYFQQMDAEVFDRIIRDAQTMELGKEWSTMEQRDASLVRLDRKVMDLIFSPYVSRSAELS